MKINSINMYSFTGRIKKGDIAKKTKKTDEQIKLTLDDTTICIANRSRNADLKPDLVTAGVILAAIPVAGTIGTLSEIN